MRLRLIHRVSAILFGMGLTSLALAQDGELPTEAFLVFLAGGMELDGEWYDPMMLANMAELQEVPEDELVWIADEGLAEIETANGDEDE